MRKREYDQLELHEKVERFNNDIEQLVKMVYADTNTDNNAVTSTDYSTNNRCIPATNNHQNFSNDYPFYPVSQIPNINLSEKAEQELSFEYKKALIENIKKLNLAQGLSYIRIYEKIALNNVKSRYNHESHTNIPHQQYPPKQTQNPITETSIEPKNVFKEFINSYSIFESEEKKYHYYIWNKSSHRHINIDRHELKNHYLNYLDNKFPSEENLSTFKKNFVDLLRLIPHQEDANIQPLPPYSVMFKNGILDVKEFLFTELSANESKRYYNSLCIDLDYNDNISSPIYFNKLLNDISNNDTNIENLICEQFGAAICLNNPEKKIFIYQGCTNAGKTRLMNILKNLLPKKDSVFLSSITKLGDIDTSTPYRFIHILELGENSLRDERVSLMKGFADGYQTSNNNPFKIFISTNHAIVTGADGYIEPALKDRLSVVPFTHPMKNEDDDVKNFESKHLNNERLSIIVKCLNAYSKSLKKGTFSKDDELNIHIDNADKIFNTASSYLSPSINETCVASPKPTPQQIIHDNFTLTDKPNPHMTTTAIAQIINDIANENLIEEPAWIGRKLKEVFGKEQILSKRDHSNSPTYYNVEKKNYSPLSK